MAATITIGTRAAGVTMRAMGASVDPAALAVILLAAVLYLRALSVLRRRGRRISVLQQGAWWSGLALAAAGLLSPLDRLAEDLLSGHMAQHLLIADLAAPLLLVGLRTPVLVFMLPRPLLEPLARRRGLRRALSVLRRPPVAIAVYVAVLYGWHLRFAFEGAMRHELVHAFQHESFVLASVLVWLPALEPWRARLRGELWKIGHILGARLAGMFLGMAFIVMRTPAYAGVYGDRGAAHGLSPLDDQQIAGGLMLSLDVIVMLVALCFFFWRAAQDHDRAEASSQRVPVAGSPAQPAVRR